MVHASGRFLQALTYYPTGAIIAALTHLCRSPPAGAELGLPFLLDQDASFTHNALWVAACLTSPSNIFDFTAHAALSHIKRNSMFRLFWNRREHT